MSSATLLVPATEYLGEMPDPALLNLQAEISVLRRQFDVAAARVAGEIARRSARSLGSSGLAQRAGLRTPEALVQSVTGATRSEARTLVRVGEVLGGSSPWLGAVSSAVGSGSLPLAAAEAIASGLGQPSTSVAADDLADAAAALVRSAPGRTPEAVAADARAVRDELDVEGVLPREAERRERRFLRLVPLPDGMTRIIGLLDPESAAVVVAAIDHVTAPSRGGPRFVDDSRSRTTDDGRSAEQLAADALVDMVSVAMSADDGAVFGDRTPSVTLHVSLSELESRRGAARIEGQSTTVSIETVERHVCASGLIPVLFDGTEPIDAGKHLRLFTRRQRRAFAARDGGCRFPGCARPPSWTEAHHLVEWSQGGATELSNGILLCRHHHLLVHNNGWVISRDGAGGFEFAAPARDQSVAGGVGASRAVRPRLVSTPAHRRRR